MLVSDESESSQIRERKSWAGGNAHGVDSSEDGLDEDLLRAWSRCLDVIAEFIGCAWVCYEDALHFALIWFGFG